MNNLDSFIIGMLVFIAVLAPFIIYSYYLNRQPMRTAQRLLPKRKNEAKVIPFKRRR